MLKYRWYAKAYGWTPSVVDDLWEDEDLWLPIVEEAWRRVEEMRAKEAQRQQGR
jgi:hypothetical protein